METEFHKDGLTVVLAGKKMSSALKERLKRCGRSYTSPVSKTQPSHTVQTSPSPVLKSEYKEPSWSLNQNTNLDDSFAECLPLSGEVGQARHQEATLEVSCKENAEVRKYAISANISDSAATRPAAKTCTVTTGNTAHHTHDTCTLQKTSSFLPAQGPGSFEKGVPQQNCNCVGAVPSDISNEHTRCECSDTNIFSHLKEEKGRLQASVLDKEEKLRKLSMVKGYHSKNELGQLQTLIDKWRSTAQEAVQELYLLTMTADQRPTLTEFIDCLHLDHKFIGYSADRECFT